jgi:hypothetical protein
VTDLDVAAPDRRLDALARALAAGPAWWPAERRPHVERASVDAIRAFALGTGDDDPRWVGPHADEARVEAPPLFLLATGVPRPVGQRLPPPLLDALRRGGRIDGERWELGAPVRVGDRLDKVDLLTSVTVVEPPHRFDVEQQTSWRRHGAVVAVRVRTRRYGAPTGPSPAEGRARARYGLDELAAIDRTYEAELQRQGQGPGELAEGAPLPTVVRGPLTTTDLISYRAAVGPGPLDAGVGLVGYRNRRAAPELFSRDASGAWDTIERLHWDDAHAQAHGHPGAYDYSHVRPVWLASYVTSWAGPGSRLESLAVEVAGHVYVGDVQWLTGTVTGADDGAADLALAIHDQRGAPTATATARVRLAPGAPGAPTGTPPAVGILPANEGNET